MQCEKASGRGCVLIGGTDPVLIGTQDMSTVEVKDTPKVGGAVLSRDEIFAAVESGDIKISPFDPAAVSCASIDLTLSNEFRFYQPGLEVVDIREETDYMQITTRKNLKEGESFLLLPGCACLGITQETVELSSDLCGLLEGRSRFARLGLFVHITAGFMNPGIKNRQVLEIYNASSHPLALWPGTKICQFIFLRMSGSATYEGKFAAQDL